MRTVWEIGSYVKIGCEMQLLKQKEEGIVTVYERGEKVEKNPGIRPGLYLYFTWAFWVNVAKFIQSLASEVRELGWYLGFLVNSWNWTSQ